MTRARRGRPRGAISVAGPAQNLLDLGFLFAQLRQQPGEFVAGAATLIALVFAMAGR